MGIKTGDFPTLLMFLFEAHPSRLIPITSNRFMCLAPSHPSGQGQDVPAVAPAIVGAAADGHADILRLLLPAAQEKVRQELSGLCEENDLLETLVAQALLQAFLVLILFSCATGVIVFVP